MKIEAKLVVSKPLLLLVHTLNLMTEVNTCDLGKVEWTQIHIRGKPNKTRIIAFAKNGYKYSNI